MTTQFPIITTESEARTPLPGVASQDPTELTDEFSHLLEFASINTLNDQKEIPNLNTVEVSIDFGDLLSPQARESVADTNATANNNLNSLLDALKLGVGNDQNTRVAADRLSLIQANTVFADSNHVPDNPIANSDLELATTQIVSSSTSLPNEQQGVHQATFNAPIAANEATILDGKIRLDSRESSNDPLPEQIQNVLASISGSANEQTNNGFSENSQSNFQHSELQALFTSQVNHAQVVDGITFEQAIPDNNLIDNGNLTNTVIDRSLPLNSPATTSLNIYQAANDVQVSLDSITDNVRQVLSRSISEQTVSAISNGVLKQDLQGTQSFVVEIHPVELGRLNIEVEVLSDAIQARIVATENFSADLLAKNKTELINALSEFGYSETSVDISHQESQDNNQPYEFDFSESAIVEQPTLLQSTQSLVLQVGVDLVA